MGLQQVGFDGRPMVSWASFGIAYGATVFKED